MYKRGVILNIFLIMLILSFEIIAKDNKYLNDTDLLLNYTINPNLIEISDTKKINNKDNFPVPFDNLLKNTTADLKLNLQFSPYTNYNEALQNTIINTTNNPELILGIVFDENNLKYLDYIPYAVYEDFVTIIFNKKYINNFKASKNLNNTINSLISVGKIVGINIINKSLYTKFYNNIDIAMSDILNGPYILLTTWKNIQNYININDKNKLKDISILQYNKHKIPYFIAVNKNSNLYKQKFDENTSFFQKFSNNLKDYLLPIKLK